MADDDIDRILKDAAAAKAHWVERQFPPLPVLAKAKDWEDAATKVESGPLGVSSTFDTLLRSAAPRHRVGAALENYQASREKFTSSDLLRQHQALYEHRQQQSREQLKDDNSEVKNTMRQLEGLRTGELKDLFSKAANDLQDAKSAFAAWNKGRPALVTNEKTIDDLAAALNLTSGILEIADQGKLRHPRPALPQHSISLGQPYPIALVPLNPIPHVQQNPIPSADGTHRRPRRCF